MQTQGERQGAEPATAGRAQTPSVGLRQVDGSGVLTPSRMGLQRLLLAPLAKGFKALSRNCRSPGVEIARDLYIHQERPEKSQSGLQQGEEMPSAYSSEQQPWTDWKVLLKFKDRLGI